MAFLCGPRQVGKTTTARAEKAITYINWDDQADRRAILKGSNAVLDYFNLTGLDASTNRLVFDEIHKYKGWRNLIKGFYDIYKGEKKFLITGSARLDS